MHRKVMIESSPPPGIAALSMLNQLLCLELQAIEIHLAILIYLVFLMLTTLSEEDPDAKGRAKEEGTSFAPVPHTAQPDARSTETAASGIPDRGDFDYPQARKQISGLATRSRHRKPFMTASAPPCTNPSTQTPPVCADSLTE